MQFGVADDSSDSEGSDSSLSSCSVSSGGDNESADGCEPWISHLPSDVLTACHEIGACSGVVDTACTRILIGEENLERMSRE